MQLAVLYKQQSLNQARTKFCRPSERAHLLLPVRRCNRARLESNNASGPRVEKKDHLQPSPRFPALPRAADAPGTAPRRCSSRTRQPHLDPAPPTHRQPATSPRISAAHGHTPRSASPLMEACTGRGRVGRRCRGLVGDEAEDGSRRGEREGGSRCVREGEGDRTWHARQALQTPSGSGSP